MPEVWSVSMIPSASRLRVARGVRGLTESQLAKKIGVTTKQLKQWEDIEYRYPSPDAEAVANIADALNWPVEFFYGDDLDLIPDEAFSF
jgi:transcriptional regulator with XRE-family HTH domain